MTADDIHPALVEALALHECFRRLSFTPDEIYVVPPPATADNRVIVTVRRSGLEFNCAVSHIEYPCTRESFAETWTAAVVWWNSHNVEATQLYRDSRAFAHKVDLVMALVGKGFSVRQADA